MSAPPGAHRGAVVVVGGGPAGASTAFWLARQGLNVTLVDRARFPRAKPCAEHLSPEAARILHAMGALEAVERAGAAPLAGMRYRSADGTTFEGRYVAGHGYRAFHDRSLALPRMELDAILLETARAAGVRITEGWRMTGLQRDASGRVIGVTGTDAKGTAATLSAAVVVGADGLRSGVARCLGLARRSCVAERYAFVSHFVGVDGMSDAGEMHIEADGNVALTSVGRGRTNVSLVVPAAHVATAHEGGERLLTRWLGGHPHLASRFAQAERLTPVRATGPFSRRARRAWAPGAALVGDAADFLDPVTGEGIYAALRGGELLAPFVADAARAHSTRDADASLEAFGRAHRREFRGKRLVGQLVGLAVSHPWLFDRAVRVFARRQELADLWVGVAGDFIPAREVLRPGFLFDLVGRVS